MTTEVAAPPERIVKTIAAGPATYKVADDGSGIVTALVSTTNALDSQGDCIIPGAYAKFIAAVKSGSEDMPSVCWSHNWERVTGVTLDMEEYLPGDDRLPDDFKAKGWGALWVKYRYTLGADDGRNAYALVKDGAIKQHSVGFMLDGDESGDQGKAHEYQNGVRMLKRIFPLLEHSDVIRGAAPGTRSTSVKAEVSPEEKAEEGGVETKGDAVAGSFEDIRGCLSAGLRALYSDGWTWIEATFADHVVYSLEPTSGPATTWSRPYVISEGKVTFGDPVEVSLATVVTPKIGNRGRTLISQARQIAAQFLEAKAAWTAEHPDTGEEKAMPIPNLIGAEAIHNQTIRDALTAINTLIMQELQEDAAEYDCIMALCRIGRDIVGWAWMEGAEYGDPPPGEASPSPSDDIPYGARSDELAAAEAEEKTEPAPRVEPTKGLEPWMVAALVTAATSDDSPVTAHVEPTELRERFARFARHRYPVRPT